MGKNTKTITNKNSNSQESNIIDLTSDDDSNNIPPNNNIIMRKNHLKKRKINIYDNEDDDDIFEMYPQTQNFVFNELPEKKKNVYSIFKNNPPKKKRKEYKLSNLQNSFDKYLNSPKTTTVKNNPITEIDSSLWIDKFTPNNSNDLAVNKKKIEEVRDWLIYNIINNKKKKPSLLILNGPSGSGKTATLKVLAEELNIEIVEWTNPINTLKISETNDNYTDYVYKNGIKDYDASITEKFKRFFMSANKYPSLEFECESNSHTKYSKSNIDNNYSNSLPSSISSSNSQKNYKYKVMLLEDVPLLTNLKTRKTFHSLIQSYFNSHNSVYSLIFIISEILLIDDDFSRKEEFSIKTYIPASILNQNICKIINFNPITITNLTNTLKKISSNTLPPSKQLDSKILKIISIHANGDIRTAINTLQFLHVYKNPMNSFFSDNNKLIILQEIFKKGTEEKFKKKGAYSLLSPIFSINAHLSLYHIIGKILYNKRLPENNSLNITKVKYKDDREINRYVFEFTLPEHLEKHKRLPLEDDPEEIISQNQIDSSVLSLFLEQNLYSFYEEIEEMDDAFRYIELADQFQNQWKRNNKDISLYSQYINMYGILHAHTNPIPSIKRNNQFCKPENWAVNKLIHQNNTQLNDMLFQWSNTLNNPNNIPFRTEHTTRSNIMTEILPYLSLIISKSNHILNREIKTSDKLFLNTINSYTNPKTNDSLWNYISNKHKFQPNNMNMNMNEYYVDDDEIDNNTQIKMDEDENEDLSSNENNFILLHDINSMKSLDKGSSSNNSSQNPNYDNLNVLEVEDDEIEEIDD